MDLPPALFATVEALVRRLPPGARVLVAGPAAAETERMLAARGRRAVRAPPAEAACLPNASAAGPVVPLFERIAEQLAPGTLVAASDLMWKTAPTPDLVAAFPGTRPMEGYEMQIEEAGFAILERLDSDRAAWAEADVTAAQRDALATDTRGAALWRTLLLLRE